jgi:hypothetical protein
MGFGQFLLYYISSTLIFQALMIGFVLGRRKYLQYKFQKAVKSGQIKIVTMDDLVNQMNSEDKKTWN